MYSAMRFNKQELLTLATQPSQKFEKEGILYVRERQEGFFRRTEIWRDGAGCGGTYYFISNRGTNGRNH